MMAKIVCLFLINTQLSLYFGSITQYEYIKQEVAPLYGELSCQVSPKSRLMDCVMISLRSKSVSFFFNHNEHICRWDCIFLASRSCTTYCTEPWSYYAIKWKTNEALSRPATSSSVYGGDSSLWGAHYSTNGAKSLLSTYIFASQNEMSPWLKVRLIGLKMITFVRVYNRRDMVGERFHDVAVEVSPDESGNFLQSGFYKGPGLTDQVIEILCDHPTSGQYVRIRITEGTSNILNIAEIEIYSV